MVRKFLSIILVITICTALAACDNSSDQTNIGGSSNPSSSNRTPSGTSISLSYGENPSLTLKVGESQSVCFELDSDEPILTSELEIASNGYGIIKVEYNYSSEHHFYYTVTALAEGTADLSLRVRNSSISSETLKIKVEKAGAANVLVTESLSNEINILAGKTRDIYIRTFGDQIYTQDDLKIFVFDTNVATIEYVGATVSYLRYKITGGSVGQTTFYIVSKSGEKISEEITVKVHLDSITDDGNDGQEYGYYVLSKNSGKFHYPNCSHVSTILPENRIETEETREELIERGYSSCTLCNP